MVHPFDARIDCSDLHSFRPERNEEAGISRRSFAAGFTEKVWIAKNLTLVFYAALSNLVLLIGILLGGSFVPNPLPFGASCLGMFLIFISSLWQIPLCLFLSRKVGMVGTVILQVGIGDVLGILFATKSNWWLCPYSWTARMITPVLGILPNGTLAPSGDPLLNPSDRNCTISGVVCAAAACHDCMVFETGGEVSADPLYLFRFL